MSLTYVLITPAHNEEDFIELTLQSVVAQTVLPKKWIIVSDGSTDRTDEIVQKYAESRDWIELVQMPVREERHFAGKAHAFNTGYEKVADTDYDIIGNLDGDVSFEEDFFEYLLEKLAETPELGVTGTHYVEAGFHSFDGSFMNVHHVNGACQLFRRECFAEIGGYVPSRAGGIDWIAVTTARMKGWKTYSFGDRTYVHHRAIGTAEGNVFKSRFHYGKKDYLLGAHPLWQLCRVCFQMTTKPYVVGGALMFLGYFWAFLTRAKRPVSNELMAFYRREQMQRLKTLVTSFSLSRRRSAP